jgi:2-isopropylmalate synthase
MDEEVQVDRIIIFDTTLRDGEQSPGCSMNLDEKLRLARQLEILGVDVIEAGFPVASEDDFAAVQAIARDARSAVVAGLCRAVPLDIERCWKAIEKAARPRIHTFVATSDIHLETKLHKSREEALEMAFQAVTHARSLCPDVEFSAEDATRSDFGFLCRIVRAALQAGATVINIPDTVGYTLPHVYAETLAALRREVPELAKAVLSVHCHDDLGLAVANSLAAVQAGARQVECTINGIGERAGNASLEELVMALRVRQDELPFETGVRTTEIYRTSQLLSNITGVHVQPNKAIVGKNAFAHESGIHQHGVLQNRGTYEIMTPESVGVKTSTIVLGKHSGRAALRQRFQEMGYPLDGHELEIVYKLFTDLCDRKKEVFDEDLLALLQDGFAEIPDAWELQALQVSSGTTSVATALVTLARAGESRTETASGDGPVHALCEAIDKITGLNGTLSDFSLRSVTRGTDALGEAHIHTHFEGMKFTGRAVSTDILEASARAYLHASNKAFHAISHRTEAATA